MTKRRAVRITLALCALTALAACANAGPMDGLHAAGPTARTEDRLLVPVLWIALGVFVIVEGLILFSAIRYRASKVKGEPVQVHGNTKMEISWTLAPALLLGIIAIPTVLTVFSLAAVPKGPNVVHIKVTGHQWWWEYEYDDVNPPIHTANEMVIPAGRQVFVQITSVDVIHSFWVPKLAGKQDAVPNRTNHLTLEAFQPGTYYGQCAQFCALSHANMRLRVIAKTPADYQTWLANQQRDAVVPTSGPAADGAKFFETFVSKTGSSCIGCHTLRGIPSAQGKVGPELTHIASRMTFAGSVLDFTPQNLTAWLTDPPSIKPGSIMPNYHLPQDAIRSLVAFLQTLK
ncbi:MAG: cytochrome c oxidase subunit II [Actinomycetota bacterium]